MRLHLYALFFVAMLVAPVTAADLAQEVAVIGRQLAPIERHARDYPPQFTSDAQRKEIEVTLRNTLSRLDALLAKNPDDPQVLLVSAFGHAMGHNLDFEGSAEKSLASYGRLVELRPKDPRARLLYGIFLNGIGRTQESIPHITKAIELGLVEANYPLAMAYVIEGKREQALPPLKIYVQAVPKDEGARRLLKSLQEKDSTIERKDGPPPGIK